MPKIREAGKIDGLTFYSEDMEEAWQLAARFAGPGGRVATLPDLMDARLAVNPIVDQNPAAWGQYITTLSAEYAGVSRFGTPILIVAHGIGPLSDLGTAMFAYERANKGAHAESGVRISRKTFLQLESGVFGPVSIVPLDDVCGRYPYPFLTPLSLADARREPLIAARLGPRWEEYLVKHDAYARGAWTRALDIRPENNPYIILGLDQPHSWYAHGSKSDPSFEAKRLEVYPSIGGSDPTEAFGHLLVASQLMSMLYQEHRQMQLVTEIGCQDPGDGWRFLGLRANANLAVIGGNGTSHDIHAKPGLERVREGFLDDAD